MKVLHTSDWHLGQLLYQQKREAEHRAFLEWLLETIRNERVELLLIAGDIFDSGLPSNYALEMYYSFLSSCGAGGCRNIIVIGGNHDSPATLQAPKPILKAINVTVVGARDSEHPESDLVTAYDEAGNPAAVICAVPYLRDRDVYFPKPGDRNEARTQGIIDGTAAWYRQQADLALKRRQELGRPDIPIIAMGHLFTQGTTKAGSERDLYVGNLGAFPAEGFPPEAAYIALGHLHRPQTVPTDGRVRYSGSPIPCSFDEASYSKQVFLFDTSSPNDIRVVIVPEFRRLSRISGDIFSIDRELRTISPAPLQTWVEVDYTGEALLPDLQDQVNAMAEHLPLQVVRCRDLSPAASASTNPMPNANELAPDEVFALRLQQSDFTENDKKMVREAFQELLLQIRQGNAS